MMDETLETFYKDDKDEEMATSRIRLVPDYYADVESMGIEGTVKFVENRRIQDFYDSLDYASILDYIDGVYGFIYETKCDCCSQWKTQNSIWGITSPKNEKIDYWFSEFESISQKV